MSDKQAPNLTAYQPHPVYEDEISLIDIVNVLLRRKKLILGIMTLVIFIGLFYAFSQQRVYQVETVLLPPSFENIQPLNVLNSNVVNSNAVFASFTKNINSRKLKKEFFDKFKLLETLSSESTQRLTDKQKNDYFESFSKSLSIKLDEKSNSTHVTLEGIYQDKIGPWLDDFIVMADQETKNQLVRNLQSNID